MTIHFANRIPTKKEIVESDLVLLTMLKDEVEAGNIDRIKQVIDVFLSAEKHGQGKLAIYFDGYNDILDEIFEIPEIRDWVKIIFDKWPFILYFLTPSPGINSRNMLTCCICDIEMIKHDVDITAEELTKKYLSDEKLPQMSICPMLKPEIGKIICDSNIYYGMMIDEDPAVIAEILDSINNFVQNFYVNKKTSI